MHPASFSNLGECHMKICQIVISAISLRTTTLVCEGWETPPTPNARVASPDFNAAATRSGSCGMHPSTDHGVGPGDSLLLGSQVECHQCNRMDTASPNRVNSAIT